MKYKDFKKSIRENLNREIKNLSKRSIPDACKTAVKNSPIGDRLHVTISNSEHAFDISADIEGTRILIGWLDVITYDWEHPVNAVFRCDSCDEMDTEAVFLTILQKVTERMLAEEEENIESAKVRLASLERSAAGLRASIDRYKVKREIILQAGPEACEGRPQEFFDHTYRAMKDYGFSIRESEAWAWLNTLFGYDIGAYRARDIISYYEEDDMSVMDLGAESRGALQSVAKELRLRLDFSGFPSETPKDIRYGLPEHL